MDDDDKMEHPTHHSAGPSRHDEQPTSEIAELRRDRLTALPLELIYEICSYFCPHCLSKDDFTPEIRRPERAIDDEDRVSDGDAIPDGEATIPQTEDVIADQEDATPQEDNATPHEEHAMPDKEDAMSDGENLTGDVCPRTTLSSLSQACRLLRIVAQSFLFHYMPADRSPNLGNFVRTLVERPDLRAMVREIAVRGPFYDCLEWDEWKRIQDELRSEGMRFIHAHACDRFALHVSLLLRLTPNLATVSLTLPATLADRKLSNALLQWNASLKLGSLKRLSLAPVNRWNGFVLDGALSFSILQSAPSVEILHCQSCTRFAPHRSLENLPRFPNLVELTLTDWRGDHETLRNILAEVGPNLSRVKIWDEDEFRPRARRDLIRLEETLQALEPWIQTLTEISFRLRGTGYVMDVTLPRSMPRFGALQILELQTDSFGCGGLLWPEKDAFAPLLPPSIRQLKIPGIKANLLLRGVLDAFSAGRLPQLSSIETTDWRCIFPTNSVGQREEWKWWRRSGQEVSQLRADFRQAGVEFVARHVEGGWGYDV